MYLHQTDHAKVCFSDACHASISLSGDPIHFARERMREEMMESVTHIDLILVLLDRNT